MSTTHQVRKLEGTFNTQISVGLNRGSVISPGAEFSPWELSSATVLAAVNIAIPACADFFFITLLWSQVLS